MLTAAKGENDWLEETLTQEKGHCKAFGEMSKRAALYGGPEVQTQRQIAKHNGK